jgi:hypothetical protein
VWSFLLEFKPAATKHIAGVLLVQLAQPRPIQNFNVLLMKQVARQSCDVVFFTSVMSQVLPSVGRSYFTVQDVFLLIQRTDCSDM